MIYSPVSVIIPTFNREYYIQEALLGMLNQTQPPKQIIVVNDGSTDNTEEVLSKYLDKINYLKQPNSGKSVAINHALNYVNEEFVWIFDDDDVPVSNFIEINLKKLKKDISKKFAYSPAIKFKINNHKKIILNKQDLNHIKDDDIFFHLLDRFFLYQGGCLIRYKNVKEIGNFREDLLRSLDYEYMLRLTKRYSGIIVNETGFYQRVHDGIRGTLNEKLTADNMDFIWYKHDQTIFNELYDKLKLFEYIPKKNKFDIRYAYLKRFSVMAKRGLWQNAIKDLEYLFKDCNNSFVLKEEEIDILLLFLESPFAVKDLYKNKNNFYCIKNYFKLINSTEMNYRLSRALYSLHKKNAIANNKIENIKFYLHLLSILKLDGCKNIIFNKV